MKKLLILSLFLLTGCNNQSNGSQEVKTGMAYYKAHGDDSVCVVSVFLEDDVIAGVTMDELTYLSAEEYESLLTTEQTTTQKFISSKVENSDLYSQAMQINGSVHTIRENFEAICEYAKGKSVEELEEQLKSTSQEDMVDMVTGCTLQSTAGYLQAIVEACRQAN